MDIKKMNKNSISDSSSIAENQENVNANTGTNAKKFGVVGSQDFTQIAKITTCPVTKLWATCWELDPFGNKFVVLKNINLPASSFKKAKKALKDAGMFEFKAVSSESDNRKTDHWVIRNLHGSKSHLFGKTTSKIEDTEVTLEDTYMTLEDTQVSSISSETHTQQALQNPSLTNQYNKETNNINTGFFIPDRGEKININKPTSLVNNSLTRVRAKSPNIPKTKDEILNHAKNCLSLLTCDIPPVQDWEWFEVDSVLAQLVQDGDLSRNEIELLYNRTKVEPFVDFLSYSASGY